MITNRTSAELLLPINDDYIIEVKAMTDGGDGISSEEIKIPKLASMFTSVSSFLLLWLNFKIRVV